MNQQAGAPALDFEIVDLRDLKRRDAGRFDRLFADFKRLYADAFPDAREREDPDVWYYA